jgi:hypothetical protein
MRTSRTLTVPRRDCIGLERLARGRNTPRKIVLRARIVLLSGAGVPTGKMMARLETTAPTITRWRNRYEQEGVPGLLRDGSRAGTQTQFERGDGAGHRRAYAARAAAACHPLEYA